MDLVSNHHYSIHDSVSPPPITIPSLARANSAGHTSFPILAVAVIGILATGFLLVSYYVLVIKCCLNTQRIDFFRRFSLSRRRNGHNSFSGFLPVLLENRGLDESVIRSIPVFRFKKSEDSGDKIPKECAVCLSEFEEDEKLKIIPKCCHVFHIDCIDIWLQNNGNCPMCRTSISCDTSFPETRIDEDFVVIEFGSNAMNPNAVPDRTLVSTRERLDSGELTRNVMNKKNLKFVKSMGDECLDTRVKDDDFGVQPIRRSISMDSSGDRKLYLAVQEAIRGQNRLVEIGDIGCFEGCSSTNSKIKRSFFSFGSGRGSNRTAGLPVFLDPHK